LSKSLFTELKRRKVFKVCIGYLLLAWIVLQVADIVVPALELPEWTIKFLILVGVLGLPFAIFFAWAYELTPEGIKKETDVGPGNSKARKTGNILNYAIIALLVTALGYFVYESQFASAPTDAFKTSDASTAAKPAGETQIPPQAPSIAVLPFVNMSSDVEQEYFSDGISEELLNLLAKTPNLRVAARTSSFQFKGRNQDIQDIGKQLGVSTILEGSIRKSGTKVRITAQLIKADDGFHIWSETYDRELTDIFEIQDEISAAIVDSLKETLGIDLVKQTSRVTTSSADAYDYYLHGLRDLYIYTFESLETAITAFESALALDPDFLLAKIKLAETYQFQIQTGSRFDREILDVADTMLKEVIAQSPELAQAYYVRSLIATKKQNRELADLYIREAYRLDPNHADIIVEYAARLGFELGEEKARELFAQASKLDPLNFRVTFWLHSYLFYTIQAYEEAEEVLRKANKNTRDSLYFATFSRHYFNLGNLVESLHYNELASANDPLDPEGPLFASNIYFCLGDGQSALEHADQALALNPALGDAIGAKVDAFILLGNEDRALELALEAIESPENVYRRISKGDQIAKAVYLLFKRNELTQAESLLTRHYPDVVALIDAPQFGKAEDITNIPGIELLSAVYRLQGKNEKAQRLAQRLSLLDESFYTRRRVHPLPTEYRQLASINAIQNNDDQAMDYLESMPNGGFPFWWRFRVLQSPMFMALQNNPRFTALNNAFEKEMAEQLARVAGEIKE